MDRKKLSEIFQDLFSRAKAADEFEYACCLLRIRGYEDAGWDPLEETHALYTDLVRLVQAPIQDSLRVRLLLLLYCHLTEVDAVYTMIYNLISVVKGDRCSSFPFVKLYRGKKGDPLDKKTPPSAKKVVDFVKEYAVAAGETKVAQALEWMFNDAIRNAFFHSDYILYKGEFRSREGSFEVAPNQFSAALPFAQLEDRIGRGIIFYEVMITAYSRHRRSYKSNKKTTGRFASDGSVIPVELLADRKRGLYGFRG